MGVLSRLAIFFLQRWLATSNPAAGYNTAVLYEAEGELENAAKLLGEVMLVTNDRSVDREYKSVLEALEDLNVVDQQMMPQK